MNSTCVFCQIVKGEGDSPILAKDETCIAIEPKRLAATGHVLIIPKQHYETIFDTTEAQLHSLMTFTQKVSKAMKEQSAVEGVNLLHASGVAAQQSIKHFHIHLIPRFENDGIDAWPKFSGSVDLIAPWYLPENT